jgi:hypothetical protein
MSMQRSTKGKMGPVTSAKIPILSPLVMAWAVYDCAIFVPRVTKIGLLGSVTWRTNFNIIHINGTACLSATL